jgi:hypothetical protein
LDASNLSLQFEEESSSFDIMILPGSLIDNLWRSVYISSCLLSPYFYAWLALHGHGTYEEDTNTWIAIIVLESIFTVNMFMNCITAYLPEGAIVPVTDYDKIFAKYFNGDLFEDLIPTLPITFFMDMVGTSQYKMVYLMKVWRI